MAYQDARLLLSGSIDGTTNAVTGQTVTTAGTFVSTNTIDLLQSRDIGEGEDLYARFIVTVQPTTGTSVEFQVIGSAAANLSSPTVLGTTGAVAVASLPVGKRLAVELSPQIGSLGFRYLGVQYVNTGAIAAGTYIADIGKEIQDGQKFYPSGFTVI